MEATYGGIMKKLVLATVVAALAGCPGTAAHKPEPASGAKKDPAVAAKKEAPTPKASPAAKKEQAVKSTKAKIVTIVGTAHRAKLAPMVQGDNGAVIYCTNIDEWPDHVLGKKVKITGTIQTTDRFKAGKDPATGLVSQGTMGGDTTMNDAKWELVTP